MALKSMLWKALKWPYMKSRLGYNGKQMEAFRKNPKNEASLSAAPA